LYNNPNFAGYELSTPEVKQLVDEGVIQAVKAAHGDPERVSDLKFTCGDVLTVFYGHDYAAFQGYAAGADGWLSGFPAAFPKQCRQLQDAIVVDGDLKKARRIWEKFIPFVDFFMDPEVNQRAHWLEMLKWAVTVQGVDIGVPRRPLGPLDEAIRDRMQAPLEVLLG
jgi:4-hydroxy-tetrahydrodipicolinate synthase